jgi:hypothetical protein
MQRPDFPGSDSPSQDNGGASGSSADPFAELGFSEESPAPFSTPRPADHDHAAESAQTAPEHESVLLINHVTFRIWLLIAWIVPGVIALTRAFYPGSGWEAFSFLLFSPVIIIVSGGLAWIPKIVLQRRGFRYSPTMVSALFYFHWWSFMTVPMALQGVGDTGEQLDSPLQQMFPFFSGHASVFLTRFAMLAVLASYVLMIVYASILKPGMQRTRWRWLPIITLGGTPIAGVLAATIIGPIAGLIFD